MQNQGQTTMPNKPEMPVPVQDVAELRELLLKNQLPHSESAHIATEKIRNIAKKHLGAKSASMADELIAERRNENT